MAEYLLEAQHLRKAFEDKTVLQDVSLGVRRGEVVVVIGPSGCGKSTLLRCLNGLESVDGGEILLDGQIISGQKKNLHLIRQRVGMVFQSYDLFPHMDVLGNLLLGPTYALKRPSKEVEAEAMAALARVGLADCAHALPELGGKRALLARFEQARDLHGQGRAAGDDAAIQQHLAGGAQHAERVDAVMLVEALVLEGLEHGEIARIDIL